MYKVGDIVKIDLNAIFKYNNTNKIPTWYSYESFTIVKLNYGNNISSSNFNNINVHLDRNLQHSDNIIWVGYLILDIMAMRKNKLERLSNV